MEYSCTKSKTADSTRKVVPVSGMKKMHMSLKQSLQYYYWQIILYVDFMYWDSLTQESSSVYKLWACLVYFPYEQRVPSPLPQIQMLIVD
jgi:hypothetical protein